MEPRRGNVTCAACEDTIPCVNNYLTFGAYDDIDEMDIVNKMITRIALTQVFTITTPQFSFIMNLVSARSSKIIIIIVPLITLVIA